MSEKLTFDDSPSYRGPPPQCVTCQRFVNVKTARKIPELGDFGVILSMEFQCKRCASERKPR